jgi:Protein of unknown function (DUF4232)
MGLLRSAALAGAIPWLPAVPPAAPVPPVAPPCVAASLAANFGIQGATGSLAGGVSLTNRGLTACSMLGSVTVRFLDGSDPAGLTQHALSPDRPEPGVPLPSLRALQPGKAAFVRVWWSNWCGDPAPTHIGFMLPSGDELTFPLSGSARCDAPSAASTLGFGAPEPLAPQPSHASRLPLAAELVEQWAVGPKPIATAHWRRGATAVFYIGLRNVSRRRFRFGPTCPTYVEGTGPGLPSELHVLNCRAVGALSPGEQVVFEMRVRVPATAPLGRNPLIWTLAPASYLPPIADGVIFVRR